MVMADPPCDFLVVVGRSLLRFFGCGGIYSLYTYIYTYSCVLLQPVILQSIIRKMITDSFATAQFSVAPSAPTEIVLPQFLFTAVAFPLCTLAPKGKAPM